MDALPIELLTRIFSFACTDGGRTGSSLSLVSRRVAALSADYRYQRVALYGCRMILDFADLSESLLRRGQRLRVREMYVTDFPQVSQTLLDMPYVPADPIWYHSRYWVDRRWSAENRTAWWEDLLPLKLSLILHGPEIRDAHIHGVNTALADILTCCSGSLRDLTISLYTPPMFALVPVHLPFLETLTLLISPTIIGQRDALVDDLPLPKPLPSLRNLNLLTLPFGEWDQASFARLLSIGPALVRARIGVEMEIVRGLTDCIPHTLSESVESIELHYTSAMNADPSVRRLRTNRRQVQLLRNAGWFVSLRKDYFGDHKGAVERWIARGSS